MAIEVSGSLTVLLYLCPSRLHFLLRTLNESRASFCKGLIRSQYFCSKETSRTDQPGSLFNYSTMVILTRLFVVAAISAVVTATVANVNPPGSKASWMGNSKSHEVALRGALTDKETIAKTANVVDQKGGAFGKPNQPASRTVVTAVDGRIVPLKKSSASGSPTSRSVPALKARSRELLTRSVNDYELVFTGTGFGSSARDAAVAGTAYLSFALFSSSTYNVDECLKFCDSIKGCVFANLYYEFNNESSNHLESSTLKCAVYGDVHTAAEKTNWGARLEPPQVGSTYIKQSTGWSSKTVVDPQVPDGYELVFGPTNAANNARGYMGFVFLDRYDVSACAQECNKRTPDPVGGACQYFNIWRAVVNDVPTTYTCSMYYLVTDASTATNKGQGDLNVTLSRGYNRKNYVIDGSFEGYTECKDFCFRASSANWNGTSPDRGDLDATVFFFQPYAHFGSAVGLLGSAMASDNLSGTLTPVKPLQTLAGKKYVVGFFQASTFSGPIYEVNAFVDVLWNGQVVTTIRPGFSDWAYYSVEVIGSGNDVLAFHGGTAPAWSFIDDITVFEKDIL